MATIAVEAHKVFKASIKGIKQRKHLWESKVDDDGRSLLTVTEADTKFKLLSLMEMSSFEGIATINIDNHEFALLMRYL